MVPVVVMMDAVVVIVFVMAVVMRAVAVFMVMLVVVRVMGVIACQVHVEFCAGNAGLFLARAVKMVAFEFQFGQFLLQFMRIDAQIDQRADEHIAADAAEEIEVEGFHG